MQKALQDMDIEPMEAGLQQVPNMMKDLSEKHVKGFLKLLEGLEDDDDVQKVYHNAEIAEALLEEYL